MDSRKRNRQRGNRNATTGDDMPPPPPDDVDNGKEVRLNRPASIRDTAPWRASQKGLSKFWANYKNLLVTSFKKMSRAEQENLVTRMCVIVTIGVTILGFLLFYNFVPRFVRVFGVPIAVFSAWWIGGKIVSQVVLGRLEDMLNKDKEER